MTLSEILALLMLIVSVIGLVLNWPKRNNR